MPKKVQNFRKGEQEIAVPSGLHNGRFGPTQQPTTKQKRRKLLVYIIIVECRLCNVFDCRFAAVLQLKWLILVNMAQTQGQPSVASWISAQRWKFFDRKNYTTWDG